MLSYKKHMGHMAKITLVAVLLVTCTPGCVMRACYKSAFRFEGKLVNQCGQSISGGDVYFGSCAPQAKDGEKATPWGQTAADGAFSVCTERFWYSHKYLILTPEIWLFRLDKDLAFPLTFEKPGYEIFDIRVSEKDGVSDGSGTIVFRLGELTMKQVAALKN